MFTYCLVTKGRRDYLLESLAALSKALKYPDVNVVIIDNGCPQDISEILSKWCVGEAGKATYFRFDINDTSAPRVWNILRNYGIDWITFPGDDDVIDPEFLDHARNIIQADSSVGAIASSMSIIDSSGKPTGQIRKPFAFSGSRAAYLAHSLHEPPFLFPGLFFKFSEFSQPLPNSRYVFDWWLSLLLVASTKIVTTSEISIQYRVHENQESALAPSRRKFFEAQLVLCRFISSSVFGHFLSSMSDDERYEFSSVLFAKPPVYGDSEFGSPLLTQLIVGLADTMQESENALNLVGDFAAMNGAYLRKGEVQTLLAPNFTPPTNSESNFSLIIAEGSCQELLELSAFYRPLPSRPQFPIGCRHSDNKVQYLVDCDLFRISPETAIDTLIVEITNGLELSGSLDFKLSPLERRVVVLFRYAKKLVPTRFMSTLRKQFSDRWTK